MATTIAFPRSLDVTSTAGFCHKLSALPTGQYAIDFAEFTNAPPFGMLLAASAVRVFVARMGVAGFTVQALRYENKSYQAHMGFFQACGLNHGKQPGQASGSRTYIPLTKLDVDLGASIAHIHDTVNRRATQLARLLLPGGRRDAHARLHYCLFEIMRNVFEHSRSPTLWYGAQAWPTKGLVEVAILDEGVGIRRNLEKKYGVASDAAAVQKAIEEGVSGATLKDDPFGFGPQSGVDSDAEDDRESAHNSGYGLYVVSQMCRSGGEFALASGDTCLVCSSAGQDLRSSAHKGVAVRAALRIEGESVEQLIQRVATKKFGETPSTRPRPMLDPL
ncbi:MAG: hypothetical protein IPK26_30825 [Planctomycetes bacterium]|nr:hypothetical protein [Planctomycetota bacterium]